MDTLRYDEEEIEELRERTETLHLSEVDPDVRSSLRGDLTAEIEDSFRIAGVDAEVVEIYVYGSWATGDALNGISDLDVRVVVDCDKTEFEDVHSVEESIRTIVGESLTEKTPFAFVDPRCVRAGSDAADGEVVL